MKMVTASEAFTGSELALASYSDLQVGFTNTLQNIAALQ
jgi:hypothetical protein